VSVVTQRAVSVLIRVGNTQHERHQVMHSCGVAKPQSILRGQSANELGDDTGGRDARGVGGHDLHQQPHRLHIHLHGKRAQHARHTRQKLGRHLVTGLEHRPQDAQRLVLHDAAHSAVQEVGQVRHEAPVTGLVLSGGVVPHQGPQGAQRLGHMQVVVRMTGAGEPLGGPHQRLQHVILLLQQRLHRRVAVHEALEHLQQLQVVLVGDFKLAGNKLHKPLVAAHMMLNSGAAVRCVRVDPSLQNL
jgi:hypothetical protein